MDYIIIALLCVVAILLVVLILKSGRQSGADRQLQALRGEMMDAIERNGRGTVDFLHKQLEQQNAAQKHMQEQLTALETRRFQEFGEGIQNNITTLRRTVGEMSESLDKRFESFQKGFEGRVAVMQESNEKKLEEMRATVDEKLQKTLEERINQSFKLVSERLEQVYKSLGEMQKLATGVDDLKKVLSNVKTRGILGEVQLGAILEQILSPEQYDTNVATKKFSQERVEYAVKLPGENDEFVYLPIDAKFPMDAYQNLLDAYDTADARAVEEAAKVLTSRIKLFAKDISSKYIDVPYTTEFAIMFLPLEGLYAEVVRRGMVEELQKLKINIAGPTTMAALLSSLQMGFKTLAIQKHSSEVWAVLEGVKQEFVKFGDALDKAQNRMRMASDELENLVGTRTRAINRRLKNVTLAQMEDKGEFMLEE